MTMHGKPWDDEKAMWDVYNAQGPDGGKDITEAIRHYDIPDGVKIAVIEKIKLSGFLTPQEIHIILKQLMTRFSKVG